MKTVLLGDLCESISSGGTPRTSDSTYWNGGIPWLNSGETRNRYIYTTEKTITEQGVKNSSTRLAKKDSTVIASAGQGKTRGQASYLMLDTYINQSIIELRPDEAKVNPKFLFLYVSTLYEQLRGLSDNASIRGSLTTKMFSHLKINLPPLDIQNKIAWVINSLDQKIEVNRRTNETLEKIGQALFKHYFIDNPKSKTWPTAAITEIVDIKYGKNLPTTNLLPAGYPVFGGNGQIGWFSKYHYDNPMILVACRGAASGDINISKPKSFVTNNSLVLVPKNKKTNFAYLKYYSLSRADGYRNFVTGSAQPQITIDSLAKCKLRIPDVASLNKFEVIIDPLVSMIRTNEEQVENLKELRDSLLPLLISGKLKV